MASRLEELTAHARRLVETGDLDAALARLRSTMTFIDPKPARAAPDQAEAAALYAAVLTRLGEPRSARVWAAYAHTASRRLYGDDDERTLSAATTLAIVLHRTAGHDQAAHLYRRLHERLSHLDGPNSPRALAAAADLATVLHARGDCDTGRELLADTIEAYWAEYGEDHRTGIRMLARLGAMTRDCGDFGLAHEHLAIARELCGLHLPPEDPLAAQVAALVRAPADPYHTCRTRSDAAEEADRPTTAQVAGPVTETDPLAALAPPAGPAPADPAEADPGPLVAPASAAGPWAPDGPARPDGPSGSPVPTGAPASSAAPPPQVAEEFWPPDLGPPSPPGTAWRTGPSASTTDRV